MGRWQHIHADQAPEIQRAAQSRSEVCPRRDPPTARHEAKEGEMTVEQEARIRLGREKIQDILPSPQYTSEQRELFLSGYCDVCWNNIFPPEDEDEEEEEENAFKYGTLDYE